MASTSRPRHGRGRGPRRLVAGEPLERRCLLAGEGLSAQYFDNADFTSSKLTRVDATVNFDWGTTAPVTGVANTTYSVRWTGAVVPAHSEVCTFTVTADDGVRLWVDDQLIINNWVNQSAKAVSGQIALTAGRPAPVKLEYYQNSGSASVKLEWSSPSQPRQVIPQARLNATATADNRGTALQETWTNVTGGAIIDLTSSTAYAGAPAYRQMITSLQSLQQDVGDSNGSRIRGYIVPSFTGSYTFSVAGNDACQLSLSTDASPANAVRIASTSTITAPLNWTASATQTSAAVTLVQGQRYYFEVLHKENGGYNHWAVGWTTPVSTTVTVIGADNIEPWGATTTLPATGILNGMSTGRDRILASPEMLARAAALVAQGGQFKTWYDTIIARADLYLTDDLPPATAPSAASGGTQGILAGLEDNLTFLAGAYKLRTAVEGNETNSLKYFTKANAIIQQVIQWSTWDTGSQFLGAAMVSQGISVCYDWMYAKFTTAQRQQIADKLYTLAIKPCIDTCTAKNYWTQWYGNWAFVCIGGVGSAALAIAPEYYKAEAETLLAKGWPVLQSSMQHFAGENGGWHEGPGYMGYGGLYLIRLMSNLQTAVGTDYALSLEKGFPQLANYLVGISTTVTGNGNNGTYPYGDGDWSQNGDPWFYWLAQRFNRGDVAKVVQDRTGSTTTTPIVTNGTTSNPTVYSFRTPWSLLWYDQRGDSATGQVVSPGAAVARTDAGFYGDPSLLQWGTSGQTNSSEHVNVWRDSWSNNAASVMFKGGYKGVDLHENLDGGSFIFDALGQRWAEDLGRDSYSLAQVGGTNYGAYRKRAEGQNTLVINPTANDYLSSTDANEKALNADQVYKDATGKPAYAPVVKSLSSDLESIGIVDLTNLYSKMRVSTVQRGFRFDRTDDSLLVQDEITATSAPEICWFMHVKVPFASRSSYFTISADGKTATITIGSNRLQCKILSGTNATFSLTEAVSLPSSPVVSGQTSNSGYTKLTIRYTGTTSERLAVWMVPLKSGQAAPTTTPTVTALSTWAPKANRQAWAGDIDEYASVSTADGLAAAAAWASQIATSTGKTAKGLDDVTGNRVVPVTLSIPLNPGEQVTWARLVAGLKTTGGSTSLDQMYLDSTTGQTYSSLGWGTLDTNATSKELTLSAAQLASLQDGVLNLAFSSNTAVDWVQLQYTTLDATAPTVVLTPSAPGSSSTPVGSVTVAFSEEVTGVDLADFGLSRGGTAVSLAGATISTADNKTFTLGGLSGITSTAGSYTLTLTAAGSGIVDTSGNAIAVGGTATWSLDVNSPTASLVPSAPGSTATPVSSVTIAFSEAVTGFAVGDLALTRDGLPVSLAAATLTTTDNKTFVLGNLLGVTSTSGTYQVTLAAATAGISDTSGNAMVQSASATWTLDRVAPTATLQVSAPGTSSTPAASATITFSEPVTGFDIADLVLTRGGQPVSLSTATLATTDSVVYSLALGTIAAVDGTYVLSLTGPGLGIADALGNAYVTASSVTWTCDTAITVAAGDTLVDATARSGSDRIVKRGAGTLVITVAGTFTGGTVVEEGTLVVQHVDALAGGALDVRAGAKVKLEIGYGTVGLASLALAATGLIDVGTGQITVAAGGFDEATIRSRLILGRNGGDWAGTAGIASSSAPTGSDRAVGYRVAGSALRVAWAAPGDLNLDGIVNSTDTSLLTSGQKFNKGAVAGVNWATGDFNYSGTVTTTDISLMSRTALFGTGSYRSAPVTVTYVQANGWNSGFNGDFTIRNTGATAINGWTLQFDLDATIVNIWNATIVSRVGTRYTITGASWNSSIGPGLEVSFGFQADGVAGENPRNRRFNGIVV